MSAFVDWLPGRRVIVLELQLPDLQNSEERHHQIPVLTIARLPDNLLLLIRSHPKLARLPLNLQVLFPDSPVLAPAAMRHCRAQDWTASHHHPIKMSLS